MNNKINTNNKLDADMADWELIKANREYLDDYYKNDLSLDSESFGKKFIRLLFGLGPIAVFRKIYAKRKPRLYISNTYEEHCPCDEYANKKAVIYTAVVGDYDTIQEPLFADKNCEYVIFTDSEIPASSIWEKRSLSNIEGIGGLGNYQKAKYCKVFPDRLFPDYDYSIWVDGNISIMGSLTPFITRMKEGYIALFSHPVNTDVYEEASTIISQGKAASSAVKRQIRYYKSQGFPEGYGLFENSILVRKHSDKRCKDLMLKWWNQMELFSWRDQLSLTYCLWVAGEKYGNIPNLGSSWRWNPRFRQNLHKQ